MRAVIKQVAPVRTLALELSETTSQALGRVLQVVCVCLQECVSALERGATWLAGRGGSWAGVSGDTERVRQMAGELLHASDLGVLAQTGSICVCVVALAWIGVCGSSALAWSVLRRRSPGAAGSRWFWVSFWPRDQLHQCLEPSWKLFGDTCHHPRSFLFGV